MLTNEEKLQALSIAKEILGEEEYNRIMNGKEEKK